MGLWKELFGKLQKWHTEQHRSGVGIILPAHRAAWGEGGGQKGELPQLQSHPKSHGSEKHNLVQEGGRVLPWECVLFMEVLPGSMVGRSLPWDWL